MHGNNSDGTGPFLLPQVWLPAPYVHRAWWARVTNYGGEVRAGAAVADLRADLGRPGAEKEDGLGLTPCRTGPGGLP